ncbi:MAG: endopeptidase La [bacterium]|nr:endopeptidase La [bacterium]
MNTENKIMPVVALRGLVVLPQMLIHFDVNRKITIEAIETAMNDDQKIFLVAQKDAEVDSPGLDDLYEIGTIASIKQIVKMPNNIYRVLVSIEERARLLGFKAETPYLLGEIGEVCEDPITMPEIEEKALLNGIKDLIQVYATETDHLGKSVIHQMLEEENLENLANMVAANVPFAVEYRLELLMETDKNQRVNTLATMLANEIELGRIKQEFQAKVKQQVDKNQKEYLLREQLKVIREELGETTAESDALSFEEKLEQLKASDEVKEKIRKEINRFKNISSNSPDSAVSRGYIETLLAMPWEEQTKDNNNIKHAEKVLNKQHYGLEKVKERILEYLAVRSLTKKGEAPIICLVGPPGTGKTTIARSVATALNKEYVRISLGGVRDEAEIRGHRRTYIGAMPGRLVNGLKQAKVNNPLMLLDEIDKVSNDYKGDTFSALLEVLDGEQNTKFVDHYLEVPVDLSNVLFVATANSLQTIPRPLLDRMEIIEVSSYTENEKLHIAKDHLVKKVLEKNGLQSKQLSISKKALEKIISAYTREAGVRNLERKLGQICRKAAKQIIEGDVTVVKVTDKNLKDYLGKEIFTVDLKNSKDEVGIVRGLAWTSVGGDTLSIEVNDMPGKGRLELTGQLGDVMKESAKTSLSYVRSISAEYGIADDYFEKKDLHIHIPEGATPKDGPSAGITMATAILSAVTNKKVKADIAMTGEVTLRGRVLPIGGLKEKLLAAKTAKISTVLVPFQNRKDVDEISEEIKENLDIKFVEHMSEVLEFALVK